MKNDKATPKEIEVARALYETDDIEIDDNAAASRADVDNGLWVAAWVWVNNEEVRKWKIRVAERR